WAAVGLVDAQVPAIGDAQALLAVAGGEDERRPDTLQRIGDRRRRAPRTEVYVEHSDVDGVLGNQLRRLVGIVRGADDGTARLFEYIDQNHGDQGLVLEHQHPLARQSFRHAL